MKTDPPQIKDDVEGSDPLSGDRVFEDRGELGRGGMGSVRKIWIPVFCATPPSSRWIRPR